jgi:pyruvate formate lyase activating enzyme
VAAALFLPGCGLRCPWCQNRELVLPGAGASLTGLEEALSHLEKRRRLLGGVVISGGEPSGHPALGPLIEEIHALGLPVKLDTNGMNPEALGRLFEAERSRPDYIALDLKLAPERYRELLPAGAESPADPAPALRESAALIRSSGAAHEYRSLALPGAYFGPADVEALAPLAEERAPWYFRSFAPGNCLDPAWDRLSPPGTAEALAGMARRLGKNALAR